MQLFESDITVKSCNIDGLLILHFNRKSYMEILIIKLDLTSSDIEIYLRKDPSYGINCYWTIHLRDVERSSSRSVILWIIAVQKEELRHAHSDFPSPCIRIGVHACLSVQCIAEAVVYGDGTCIDRTLIEKHTWRAQRNRLIWSWVTLNVELNTCILETSRIRLYIYVRRCTPLLKTDRMSYVNSRSTVHI